MCHSSGTVGDLRLLECWLPLAQWANLQGDWRAGAAELEELIASAAPALARVSSIDEAYAILCVYKKSDSSSSSQPASSEMPDAAPS